MNTGTSHEPGISLTYRRAFIHADQRRRIRGHRRGRRGRVPGDETATGQCLTCTSNGADDGGADDGIRTRDPHRGRYQHAVRLAVVLTGSAAP